MTDKYITPSEWLLIENELKLPIHQFFKEKKKSGFLKLESTFINLKFSFLPASHCKVKISSEHFMQVVVKSVTRRSSNLNDTDKTAPNFIEVRKKLVENQKNQKKLVNKIELKKPPHYINNTPTYNTTENEELEIFSPKFNSTKNDESKLVLTTSNTMENEDMKYVSAKFNITNNDDFDMVSKQVDASKNDDLKLKTTEIKARKVNSTKRNPMMRIKKET